MKKCVEMQDGKPCNREFKGEHGLNLHMSFAHNKHAKKSHKKTKHKFIASIAPSFDSFIALAKKHYKEQLQESSKLEVLSKLYKAIETVS